MKAAAHQTALLSFTGQKKPQQNKAWQGSSDSTVNFYSIQPEKHFDSITAVSIPVTGSRAGITNF